jgi:stage II sporulation protein AA (anti-sigma F factor antagonist)
MAVTLSQQGEVLTAFLSGDLDHHNSAQIRTEIDSAVRTSEVFRLILDFSRVNFMDSSGIGLVMGRYKLMNERGGVCIIANPPAYIGKVMKISGINRLCEVVHTQNLPNTVENEGNSENDNNAAEETEANK